MTKTLTSQQKADRKYRAGRSIHIVLTPANKAALDSSGLGPTEFVNSAIKFQRDFKK